MTYDHDSLFRYTFSQPEHARSLLQSILPAAIERAIDWATLQPMPGSSVDEELQSRHADLLFTAQIAGVPTLIYVLLEHKSGDDHWTALQLLRYVVRTLDRHLAEHPDCERLPPIVPVVVHHGERAWRAPRSVLDLFDLEHVPPAARPELIALLPKQRFLLDDLAALPEAEIAHRRASLLSRLTLLLLQFVRGAEERDPVDLVQRWRELLQALFADTTGRPAMIALFSYLAAQLEAPRERLRAAAKLIHEDTDIMGKTIADQFREEGFHRGHDQGVAKGVAQGVAQGLAQGELAGRAQLLLRQLRQRFGDLDASVEQRVRAADLAALDRFADRVLTAPTLDAVLR